ncbi:GDP-L-fucose synthase family protein [Campylobacter canadensis]|uniref:GDP-L-fucose synthase family protein n=1 Tax=Campylobacter canadensis TaxID=449520 RepID=UPI001CCABFAA|nr:GDP-L-fucose synthase [Campylobacter canadensis]MBZ8003490.1 GDP-L-fucose synthase [Campylobacter canadensis]
MNKDSKIYIAGHKGLVGSSILKKLRNDGYKNLIFKTRFELDLTNQQAVSEFFVKEKPEYIFFCAAKMGGMLEQLKRRADFLYLNLAMQTFVLHEAYKNDCKKLLYLSSLCIYPQDTSLPIKETSMLDGKLQFINEPYAIAKITGNKMCEFYNHQFGTNFITLVPTSIYGPGDNFNLATAHVFPAIFAKIYLGKLLNEKRYDELLFNLKLTNIQEVLNYLNNFNIDQNKVTLFGTGKPRREFIFVDDVADACIFAMNEIDTSILKKYNENFHNTHLNLADGKDYSISEIANLIKEILDYRGEIIFDSSKPDGTMLKTTNSTRLKELGWKAKIKLEDGIKMMYEWYLKEQNIRQ